MSLRARILAFIAVLMALAVQRALSGTVTVLVACLAYLALVLPAIDR